MERDPLAWHSQAHNLNRPIRGRRRTIYAAGSALGAVTVVFWVLVATGVMPPHGSANVAAVLTLPALFCGFVAFWDNPGELRTPLERGAEFVFVWLFTTASIQASWEAGFLILDTAGILQGATAADHGLWGYWMYGRVDTRYLNSDDTVVALEMLSVPISPIGLYGAYLLAKGRRIIGNWIAILYVFAITVTTVIYYFEAVKTGFRDIEGDWVWIVVEFVGWNIPWVLAPALMIPLAMRELRYLHHREVLDIPGGTKPAVMPSAMP
jgi:hypothetical protein